ncbi:putative pao retrotransposon peptidase superfamily [Trichonephila clavata]|uniref:Putative pao retrotransposon peptidase superfamily n=1 Tax=Trichonephila clavata TaxID=2740835 RepID=A0A8X6IEL4_TRICU|nr:putative pao retrotransposon peptidase superfamily [Trichonephila clavata]
MKTSKFLFHQKVLLGNLLLSLPHGGEAVELDPWRGGFYERLMRAVKEPFRKILGKAHFTFEETMSLLAEIENVLNHRPLTYVSGDISDPEPLKLRRTFF